MPAAREPAGDCFVVGRARPPDHIVGVVAVAGGRRGIAAEGNQMHFETVAIMAIDHAVDRFHPVRFVEEGRDVADPQFAARRGALRAFDRADAGGEAPPPGAPCREHVGVSRRSAARHDDGEVLFGNRAHRRVRRRAAIGIDRRLDFAQLEQHLGQQAPGGHAVRLQAHGMLQGIAGLAIGADAQAHAAETIPGRKIAGVGGDYPTIGVRRCVELPGPVQRISRSNVGHWARIQSGPSTRSHRPEGVDSMF